jgi:hypothetical protein
MELRPDRAVKMAHWAGPVALPYRIGHGFCTARLGAVSASVVGSTQFVCIDKLVIVGKFSDLRASSNLDLMRAVLPHPSRVKKTRSCTEKLMASTASVTNMSDMVMKSRRCI